MTERRTRWLVGGLTDDLPADTFANAGAFRAAAVADIDGRDGGLDLWVVDHAGAPVHVTTDCDFRWIDELSSIGK